MILYSPLRFRGSVSFRLFANGILKRLFLGYVLFGVWSFAERLGFGQSSFHPNLFFARNTESKFETPEATMASWMLSVNREKWADEFACYSGFQRSKFTYEIMVSTHDLLRDEKLAKEAGRIFLKYDFPSSVLDGFLPHRIDSSHLTDPEDIREQHDAHLRSIRASIERWEREIQPLDTRWEEMIGELQPLLVTCYERYRTADPHINTGIVFHLRYHRFVQSAVVDVQEHAARGTAVALLRDTQGLLDPDSKDSNPIRIRSAFTALLKSNSAWAKSKSRRTRIDLQFVKEGDDWKIDSVPLR